MASSTNSMRKSLSFSYNDHEKQTDESFEESSWTMYFEDFFAGNNINGDNNNGFLFTDDHDKGCNSLVSDAASLFVEKSAETEKAAVGGLPGGKSYSRLSFKKRKTKEAIFDDSLEDTASSPANSPKVCDLMNQFNNKIKQKASMDISQEKGSGASSHVNERSELGFLGTESDCSELKKRGLCLVPMSTVVNYLG